jgi:putative oxidoreductase
MEVSAIGAGVVFRSIGLNPGYPMALLAGAAEFFGGLDKGGHEYALAPFAASVSLPFSGAGRLSVDRALTGER